MATDHEQTVTRFVTRYLTERAAADAPPPDEVLLIFEFVWANVRHLLAGGHPDEALTWARLGVQVADLSPVTHLQAIHLCAWMIRECGHQEGDPLLDSERLIQRALSDVPWTPAEARHLGTAWRTQPPDTVKALRRLKNATAPFDGVMHRVPLAVREQMGPWLTIRTALP